VGRGWCFFFPPLIFPFPPGRCSKKGGSASPYWRPFFCPNRLMTDASFKSPLNVLLLRTPSLRIFPHRPPADGREISLDGQIFPASLAKDFLRFFFECWISMTPHGQMKPLFRLYQSVLEHFLLSQRAYFPFRFFFIRRKTRARSFVGERRSGLRTLPPPWQTSSTSSFKTRIGLFFHSLSFSLFLLVSSGFFTSMREVIALLFDDPFLPFSMLTAKSLFSLSVFLSGGFPPFFLLPCVREKDPFAQSESLLLSFRTERDFSLPVSTFFMSSIFLILFFFSFRALAVFRFPPHTWSIFSDLIKVSSFHRSHPSGRLFLHMAVLLPIAKDLFPHLTRVCFFITAACFLAGGSGSLLFSAFHGAGRFFSTRS